MARRRRHDRRCPFCHHAVHRRLLVAAADAAVGHRTHPGDHRALDQADPCRHHLEYRDRRRPRRTRPVLYSSTWAVRHQARRANQNHRHDIAVAAVVEVGRRIPPAAAAVAGGDTVQAGLRSQEVAARPDRRVHPAVDLAHTLAAVAHHTAIHQAHHSPQAQSQHQRGRRKGARTAPRGRLGLAAAVEAGWTVVRLTTTRKPRMLPKLSQLQQPRPLQLELLLVFAVAPLRPSAREFPG